MDRLTWCKGSRFQRNERQNFLNYQNKEEDGAEVVDGDLYMPK